MNVVLADIEPDSVEVAAKEIAATGVETLAVTCDVRDGDAVDAVAAAAVERFGPVHVLCNNAGVAERRADQRATTADWEWVLGVNLWGVVHGVRAFLPGMLAHGEPGHIVNTASMAGLLPVRSCRRTACRSSPSSRITESLHAELTMLGSALRASVLCPGWVSTRIYESGRNRPAELGGPPAEPSSDPASFVGRQMIEAGIPPSEVADQVVSAIRDERFYVLTHPEMLGAVEGRMQAILSGGPPRLPQLPT